MVEAARKSPKRKAAPKSVTDPVDAMLALVAADGWRGLTMAAIASASGLSLADLYAKYRSKSDLLAAFAGRIDAAMLATLGTGASPDDPAKDRLFEVIMARLDALAPHKAALRVLARELPGDPLVFACFLYGGFRRGVEWILAAAGLDGGGLAGIVRGKVLAAVYADTLRVWLRDESPDMGATMAHLDKRLDRAMSVLDLGGRFSRMREKKNK